MRLGMFMMPLHKPGTDYTMYQRDYEAVRTRSCVVRVREHMGGKQAD
ncbi:MAG: hypothetical protein OET44_20180 [Gammaproteobacteria bacterium]|nr:hypothetical protein [Gammaproteobacteria bacterium]